MITSGKKLWNENIIIIIHRIKYLMNCWTDEGCNLMSQKTWWRYLTFLSSSLYERSAALLCGFVLYIHLRHTISLNTKAEEEVREPKEGHKAAKETPLQFLAAYKAQRFDEMPCGTTKSTLWNSLERRSLVSLRLPTLSTGRNLREINGR